jgi:hypothetical protein
MKSANLNFLEPSGPLQTCNGTALPFYAQNMVHLSSAKKKKSPMIIIGQVNKLKKISVYL